MIMDPHVRGFFDSMNGSIVDSSRSRSLFPDGGFVACPRFENSFPDRSSGDSHFFLPGQGSSEMAPYSAVNPDEESPEDCDFSDTVLKYINQMLMEEDMEDKTCMFQESLDLQAAEKSFHDVLCSNVSPSSDLNPSFLYHNAEIPGDNLYQNYFNTSSEENSQFADSNWISNISECSSFHGQDINIHQTPQSSSCSSNPSTVNGLVDSPISTLQQPDICSKNGSVCQFQKGVEEASKFLPNYRDFITNLEKDRLFTQEPKEEISMKVVKVEEKDDGEYSPTGSRGRKNIHREDDIDLLEEERSSKQAAVYTDPTLRSKMFDDVLLCVGARADSPLSILRDSLQNGKTKNLIQTGPSKGSNGAKGRGRKQSGKKEVVDLRTLLIHCAQAVAADDRRSANELLKQIRQHSSPFGDGNQRMAHCFADGLEARLAGTGSHIYKALTAKRRSAADILKAYHLFSAACPFRKISNFYSNRTIMNLTAKATRVHIIDFGILYGFQWPTFILRLSQRDGGPPKLKITGIEFPQPGFRPAEGVKETGRRLADYAKSFNVPFEYEAIAKKWETIKLEDLKIDKDEVLVVNCLYRLKNLLDETVVVDSPRDKVIKLIREINPDIFLLGIVNGSFSAPFFVTRFREALFHYSALFDMLETNVPREHSERMLIEKEIFGREALNVIACEGWERVERPETYKQWQVRVSRTGFVQLPLNREIIKKATERVRSFYHKDFVIDEDGQWLLQGWKGRITFALSSWRPT